MTEEKYPKRILDAAEFDPTKSVQAKEQWPDQTFHVSHLSDEDFQTDSFRPYALARDLGFAEATGGMVEAHVHRRARPFNAEEVSKPHFHDTLFQLVYVLKGWMLAEFEGQGTIEMRAGSSWIQPPNIKHVVRGFSDDLEILEVIIPAEYDTYNLPASSLDSPGE
jgi:quercetin dioxygenase-like cupin family protein